MTYKEVNAVGHKLGETLHFTFDNLRDDQSYNIAIVAVDRWGNSSQPVIQHCKTKLNHAPEVTDFPEKILDVPTDGKETFNFKVADPDGQEWSMKTNGETKGVSYSLNHGIVTVNIVPVLAPGSYTCSFIFTDDLGAVTVKTLPFRILKYVPPTLETPFDNYIIGWMRVL